MTAKIIVGPTNHVSHRREKAVGLASRQRPGVAAFNRWANEA